MKEKSLRRWIEREFLNQLPARNRARLFETLRLKPEGRAHYDRLMMVWRGIEGEESWSREELTVVKRRLELDLHGDSSTGATAEKVPEKRPRRRKWWWFSAVASMAAMVLWVAIPGDDAFAPRGGDRARPQAAIMALCGEPPRPASERGCGLEEPLSFSAYREAQGHGGEQSATADLHLSLFGIGEAGDLLYYTPTPASPEGIRSAAGAWEALPFSVRLQGEPPGRQYASVRTVVADDAPGRRHRYLGGGRARDGGGAGR